ncbi:hypothetical protein ACCO45_001160 [Purpureocillium lilacinum]|uniref:Uncharacterized protein n=1 Tax=Purpureocillium lilacinum TaxID=33203 RepID=A0ACC4E679_PURLI
MSPVREDLVPQNASIQAGQVWNGGVYFSPLFAKVLASQYRVSIGSRFENPFPRQYGRLYRLNVVQQPTPRSEKDVAVVLPPTSGGHTNPAIRARAAV